MNERKKRCATCVHLVEEDGRCALNGILVFRINAETCEDYEEVGEDDD